MNRLVFALLKTLCVFSTMVWFYEVGVSWFASQWLGGPLTHYDIFPLNMRNDTFGILAFLVALVSYFLLQLLKTERNHMKRSEEMVLSCV